MISLRHDRPTSPPSISRTGISVNTSLASSSSSSPCSPGATILSPNPSSDPSPEPPISGRLPSPPLAGPSALSSLTLESNAPFLEPPLGGVAEALPLPQADMLQDIYFDDEGLSSLEKIYLFARSRSVTHRAFISRSLHTFLPDVSPLEAVEYVLPLLNALAVDEEELVKEALVANLVATMWWFFENCQLVEEEPSQESHEPPLLPVQTFTPILGSLLIDYNKMICGPARFAVVEVLNRLRAAETKDEDHGPFGKKERKLLEQEMIQQVIIGMGRLDVSEESRDLSPPPTDPVWTSSLPPQALSHLLNISPPPHSPPQIVDISPSQPTTDLFAHPTLDSPLTPPVPALSPVGNLSLTPDSSVGPISPPSEERQAQVSLASPSPRSSGEAFLDWIPPSPHPGSEPKLETITKTEDNAPEEEGWVTSEGHDSSQEEANQQAAVGRWSSMSLIATVTANATLPEEAIRAFADEVAYIAGDPFYWVRREVSFAVGALAKVIPQELVTLTLLPLFDTLTHDTVWQVRHSAIYALPSLLARLTPQHRRALALDTLLPATHDVAPTVRLGVFEVLGEVIYAFHEDEGGAPEEIVGMFVGREDASKRQQHQPGGGTERWLSDSSMTKIKKAPGALPSVFEGDDDPLGESGSGREGEQVGIFEPSPAVLIFRDPERPLITSYNYPAVALSLGPQRWGELREYYLSLTRDGNIRVRRTIAAGLGEMARILGADIAQRDLLDVWQEMVHDTQDGQTRLKALGGLSMLVDALEEEAKEGVVGGLVELWERWLTGWRERECLTGALPRLAALAERQGEAVRTLLGKALVDNVAAVREAAIEAVSPVLCAFEGRPHLAEALRDDIQGLACADSCRRRATYVACYQSLVESENGEAEIARNEFLDHIVHLSRDRIVDVRIGVARLLGVICDKAYCDPLSRPTRLSEVVRRLGQDPSRDVRAFVAILLVPPSVAKPQDSPIAQELTITSPVMFATFSRPPPKSPPIGAMPVGGIQGLTIDEDFQADIPEVDLVERDVMMPGHWPMSPHGVDGPHFGKSSDALTPEPLRKVYESKEPGETTNIDRSIPLVMQQQRLDNWEPT